MWGSSGSDVFAVGDSGTILHYDGSQLVAHDSGTQRLRLEGCGAARAATSLPWAMVARSCTMTAARWSR